MFSSFGLLGMYLYVVKGKYCSVLSDFSKFFLIKSLKFVSQL